MDLGGDLLPLDSLREVGAAAPVDLGAAAEELRFGLDPDAAALRLGVEAQVEQMCEGFEQLDLPDGVAGDVGEGDLRPESGARHEERPERALLVERERHPLFGPVEEDVVEAFG